MSTEVGATQTEALRKIVSREPIPRPADGDSAATEARSKCSTGLRGRDTVCLMQANPLFAENVLAYLVWKRLKQHGAMSTYSHALTWPEPNLLQQRLGTDVRLFDASTALAAGMPSAERTQWAVELPRVFTNPSEHYRAVDVPQPASCWHDIEPVGDDAHKWWQDEIRIERDVTADPRWARCYMLPAPAAIVAESITHRPRFEAILEELRRLDYSIGRLSAPSATALTLQ